MRMDWLQVNELTLIRSVDSCSSRKLLQFLVLFGHFSRIFRQFPAH